MSDPFVCLVPHAGKKYAGEARDRVFECCRRNLQTLVFLAADHHNAVAGVCSLWARRLAKRVEVPPWVSVVRRHKREHSYLWVEKELPFAETVMVITLGGRWQSRRQQLIWWVTDLLSVCPSALVVTADLTHYGPSYGLTHWPAPVQQHKQRVESPVIAALVQGNPLVLSVDTQVTCAPRNLEFLSLFAQDRGLRGRVVSYYDSVQSLLPVECSRGFFTAGPEEDLVSYVGIVFSDSFERPSIGPVDVQLALGVVRNTIAFERRFEIPSWSPLHLLRNGVFVGSELGTGNINCSTGRFESPQSSLANNITSASLGCKRDAEERWEAPYPVSLEDVIFKVEILQEESDWKGPFSARELQGVLTQEKQTKYGVLLTTAEGMTATYLPGVWKEALPGSSLEEFLRELQRKAGGSPNDDVSLLLYTSRVFKCG